MSKNKIWLGIILSIILLVFSINGSAAYYKYTQESGTNFFVGTADKADSLEDANELRQIIDDLGALLFHSKRNDLYPKDSTTGGTIQIPETGLKFSNDPANNDIAAYIAGEMSWQTKAELGLDLSLYYLKTQIDTLGEVEAIYVKDITDSTELAAALGAYYLKTAIDTQGEVETIWGVSLVNDGDLDLYYLKTAINTQAKVETIWGVNLATDSELAAYTSKSLFDAYTILYADTDNTPAALSILPSRIVGRAAAGGISALDKAAILGIINVEDGADVTDVANVTSALGSINADALADITSSGANIEDAVTKKHAQNTDTDLNATFEATFVKKIDTVNVLSDITSSGANIEDAVTKKHTQNTDTALGTQTQDLNMGTHKIIGVVDPANPQDAATKAYADTKVATEVDPTVDSDSEIKAILVDEVTKTGTLTAGNLTKTNNATGVIEDAGVATETTITLSDAKVPTSKAVNDFCETTKNYMQELEDDPYPKLGSDLSLNTHSIFMYVDLVSDQTYSGLYDQAFVGEIVAFGDLLYLDWTTKKWKKADADLATNMPGLRIALEDQIADLPCYMLVTGYIRDDTWEFTGPMIYVSATAGSMTSTAPSAAGQQLQRVGVAKSADILFFDPSIDVGEI